MVWKFEAEKIGVFLTENSLAIESLKLALDAKLRSKWCELKAFKPPIVLSLSLPLTTLAVAHSDNQQVHLDKIAKRTK